MMEIQDCNSPRSFNRRWPLSISVCPGMSGYEVCTRLRTLAQESGVRCVALTGFGAEEDRKRSRDAGFDHHMVKPIEFAGLQDLLRQILQ